MGLNKLAVGILVSTFLVCSHARGWEASQHNPDKDTVLLLHFDGTLTSACGDLKPDREEAVFVEDGAIKGALDAEKTGSFSYSEVTGDDFVDGFTVETWCKLRRPKEHTTATLLRLPGAFECNVYVYPNNRAKAHMQVRTDKGNYAAKTSECLPYGPWLHVMYIYSPKNGLNIRVNCTDAATFTGYQTMDTPKGRLKQGRGRFEIGRRLTGLLDELRVSKVVRKRDECEGNWPSGRPGDFLPFHPMNEIRPVPEGADPNAVHPLGAEAIPTFHSMSLYQKYAGDSNGNSTCKVRYRKKGTAKWRHGLDLIPDRGDREFRGSLVYLQPDTEYEMELALADPDGSPGSVRISARTWNETVPVAETKTLPAGTVKHPLVITDRGTPDGWILYAPPKGETTTIDGAWEAPDAVKFDGAAYVIFRGVKVVGGARNAVAVTFSHHIRIERCEMVGWGDPGKKNAEGRYADARGRLINGHVGVNVGVQSSQVVVQHCYIHDPRGTANSWEFGHPAGPQGVILANTNGNNVVRYNDIVGSDIHRWNDAIESVSNGAVNGGPYRDTDIYGNYLLFANDDSVELDGGQINVRFWDNHLERALCGISCAPCRKGPCYVFMNLITNLGDERGVTGSAFKMGGGSKWSPGIDVILHNTIETRGGGLNSVGYGYQDDGGGYRAFARNNLFAGPKNYIDVRDNQKHPLNSFDYDLMGRRGFSLAEGNEKHGVRAVPNFINVSGCDYNLSEGSPGIDMGVRLPGVNDDFVGKAPDAGAYEFGRSRTIPARASGVVVRPGRLLVKGVARKGIHARENLWLVMPKSAGTRWQAHCNMPWLHCEPASGKTLDAAVRLTVEVDVPWEVPGAHHGAVTFRSDLGCARTIVVSVKVYNPLYTQAVEAEACELTAPMQKLDDAEASGGVYVAAPPETNEGAIKWEFSVEKTGTYYIIGRCLTPEPCGIHDSFFFSMDGAARNIWDVEAGPEWTWCVLNARGKPRPFSFKLEAGKHILVLSGRERDTKIDKIVVSSNPYPEP